MSANLASDDRELIQQLLDDVGILEDQFLIGIPKPPATRAVLAPILRRWVAEALFFKAQKLIMPVKVNFAIMSNAHATKLCEDGVYEHWMGVVVFGQIGVGKSQVAQKYLGPDGKPTIPLGDRAVAPPEPQKAKRFFEQKMFFWKGQFYTRADVIKMHANALGGVHFDFRRTEDETHINEIKNYFGFELKGNNSQMLVGNDISLGRADPARRQQVFDATELVAMDTARIFADGIRASQGAFSSLLT